MGKKIARGIGIAVCILLFVLCVSMIVMSAMFGSADIVKIFGYNMYLCEQSPLEGIKNGSAVIVERCEPYDLDPGTPILYTVADESAPTDPAGTAEPQEQALLPVLGYAESATLTEGVYYIEVSDSADNITSIMGSALIGKAAWSSPVLGRLISFSQSPWGVCVMAVLPCLALIVFSLVKSAMDNAPLPEVLPQKKNAEQDDVPASASLGVKADGNAEYARSTGGKPASTAEGVLFTYGSGRKSPAVMKPAPTAEQTAPPTSRPAPKVPAQGSIPTSVAARKYIDSATAAQKKSTAPHTAEEPAVKTAHTSARPEQAAADNSDKDKLSAILGGSTAELPMIPKKKRSDAFFAQSEAPQIGRSLSKNNARREVIDLEDALATAAAKESKKHPEPAGRKSAAILASKSRAELIADDDDSRDRSRYDVDDILAGMERRR